jgi:CubicO group peptidase (beta-lactamase class C family)
VERGGQRGRVDPVDEIIVIMMTQRMPITTYPLWQELRMLSYHAVID